MRSKRGEEATQGGKGRGETGKTEKMLSSELQSRAGNSLSCRERPVCVASRDLCCTRNARNRYYPLKKGILKKGFREKPAKELSVCLHLPTKDYRDYRVPVPTEFVLTI